MKKKTFNPNEWLHQPQLNTVKIEVKHASNTNNLKTNNNENDIEKYIAEIEKSSIDITGNYATWRDIGFAFADEYAAAGRSYFHRVSKFHTSYNAKDCDNQFDKCLKAKGTGITIGTFYHHTKSAGISFNKNIELSDSRNNQILKEIPTELPTFPKSLFPQLPQFLQKVLDPAESDEEKDILLLGALTALSACFPKIHGIYDGQKTFSNLYLFVTAPASAGKGRLNLCKKLVYPVHKAMREQASLLKKQHDIELAEYNKNKGKDENLEKPTTPPERMLFIPANNSTTGVFQLLSDNEGRGLIFETEGDTLSHAFKTDYGNYSDGFRKAFHHETISYYRRTDREYVDMESPCLSTVLSGTPKQVTTLIPNAENGLFSRFIFYYMNIKPIWKNVFASKTTNGLEEYYSALGEDFLEFYKTLKNNPAIQIILTPEQEVKFNDFFSKIQTKYINIQSEEYIATIRRLGLIAFRLMMLFTTLRIWEDGDINPKRVCEDIDFDNAISMIDILVKHSSMVFSTLPEDSIVSKPKNRKERYLEALPAKFSRQIYLDKAIEQKVPSKTAEGWITSFVKSGLIHRDSQGKYIHPEKIENKQTEKNKETEE